MQNNHLWNKQRIRKSLWPSETSTSLWETREAMCSWTSSRPLSAPLRESLAIGERMMVQRLQGEAGGDPSKGGTILAAIWTTHQFYQAGQLTILTQMTPDQTETSWAMKWISLIFPRLWIVLPKTNSRRTVLNAKAEEAHSWTRYRSPQIGSTMTRMAVGTSEPIDSSNTQLKTFLKLIEEKAHHAVDSQGTIHHNAGATLQRNENTKSLC